MTGSAFAFNWTASGDPSYTARQLRQLMVAPFVAMGSAARPLGAKSGLRVGTPASIAAVVGTGPYTYAVQPFVGVIDAEANAAAAPYSFVFAAAETGNINAAGSVLRVDRLDVVLSDKDEGDSSGAKTVQLVYTAGANTGSLPPAAPARSTRVCYINVPTSGAPTITWNPEWSGDPGEWTFNTIAERDAYVTAIGSANVPPQQQATILGATNGTWTWTGAAWTPALAWVSYKPHDNTPVPFTGSIFAIVDFASWFLVDRGTGDFPTPGTNYLFKAPYAGRYAVEVDYFSNDSGLGHILALKKNSVSADSTSAFAVQNYTGVAGVSGCTIASEIDLAVGDQVSMVHWVSASGSNVLKGSMSATMRFLNA